MLNVEMQTYTYIGSTIVQIYYSILADIVRHITHQWPYEIATIVFSITVYSFLHLHAKVCKTLIIFINFCRSYCAFDYLVINLNSISCILFISHIHIHLFLLASHSRHMYALAYLFFFLTVEIIVFLTKKEIEK